MGAAEDCVLGKYNRSSYLCRYAHRMRVYHTFPQPFAGFFFGDIVYYTRHKHTWEEGTIVLSSLNLGYLFLIGFLP